MSDPQPHSAAGQALGYVHQVQWSLVELLECARKAPSTFLRLESLDDVEIVDAGTGDIALTQIKHQVRPAADLTENSVDLWRSLNVWMDVIQDLEMDNPPVLKLVTTASIPEDGALNYLRADPTYRDVDRALSTLEDAAQHGGNKRTQLWRARFTTMAPEARRSLLALITIDDGSPRARDAADAIAESLRYAAPYGHVDTFVTYLLGWWYKICVQLLDGSLGSIAAADLEIQISDLRDQFLPDNLPIAPDVRVPFSDQDSIPYRDRQFVQQLMWIALDDRRLWMAIRDYHRAWTQRSEWLRLNLTCEPELDHFAFRLHDEWEQIFYNRVAKMKREGVPASELAGQEILEMASAESKARVRARVDEGWLTRGTLHALADGWSNRVIGWHPDFEAKLAELLAGVSRD